MAPLGFLSDRRTIRFSLGIDYYFFFFETFSSYIVAKQIPTKSFNNNKTKPALWFLIINKHESKIFSVCIHTYTFKMTRGKV